MSVITKGKTFANGEQLTAGKLNQMLDAATFGSGATDNTKVALSGGRLSIAPNAITLSEVSSALLINLYPVGSIYINAGVATNPGTLMGFGTWERYGDGKLIVSQDSTDSDFNDLTDTGGSKTVTLTKEQSGLPSHFHEVGSTGSEENEPFSAQSTKNRRNHESGQHTTSNTSNMTQDGETRVHAGADAASSHDNMPPYVVAYMWKRTA